MTNFIQNIKKYKNGIENNLKNDLINFINSFLIYSINDEYLEDYVLNLIHEFEFDNFNEILQYKNDNITNKINSLNSIKLILIDNANNVIHNENYIYEQYTPEYCIKNKNNLDKNKLKNKRMVTFFDKFDDYKNLIKSKMNIGNIDLNH